MKFRNPKTDEIYDMTYSDCSGSGFCRTVSCNDCPIQKRRGDLSCRDWVLSHPDEAAALMGYEVVEDEKNISEDRFLRFLRDFKKELESRFEDAGSWDAWCDVSGTGGWATALKAASESYMPEIWPLWDKLDWWASDMLDSWLIDCAEYMGLIQKTDKEANMDKPRICEVLGVEVNERVYYKEPNGETVQFFINEDGTTVWVFERGKPLSQYGIGYAIAQAINHPDRIIRKSRWTEQEVEAAVNLRKILDSRKIGYLARERDGELRFCDNYGNEESIFSSISLSPDLFPSIQPGQSYTLDEIIGGAE